MYVEAACAATLGGKLVRFAVCDRFTITDGKLRERHSYSDSLPVLATSLRRPTAWPRLLRSRLR